MAVPEIIKALDPLLAKLAEIEERREKIDREMLVVLREIAKRIGVPEIVIPPPVAVPPAPPTPIYLTVLPPEVRAEILSQIELHPEWAPAIQIVNVPERPIVIAGRVIPQPTGPIRAFDKKTTTSTFQTIAELTPSAGKTFHITKIVVSCLEDSEAQLYFKDKELTVIYKIMGKMPFTDWYPYDYRTHPDLRPIIGDGTSKLELKARYPTGGTPAECYGEIVGEEL